MEDTQELDDNSFEALKSNSQLEWTNAFFSIFSTNDLVDRQGRRSYAELAQPVLFLLNMMSLAIPSLDVIEGFSEGYWFFAALNYLRLDALAWNMGLEQVGSVIALTFVLVPALMLVSLTYIERYKAKFNYRLLVGMRWLFFVPLSILKEASGVPVACMLLSMIKYGVIGGRPVEYIDATTSSLNVVYSILGCLTLPVFLAEMYIGAILLFRINFNNCSDHWFARPHSFVQARSQLVVLCLCIIEFTHDKSSPQLFSALSCISLAYLCFMHINYLPYYNDRMNTLYSSIYAFLASTSLATLLAFHFESAAIIIVTSLIMFPCYLVIINSVVNKSAGNLSRTIRDCRTPYEGATIVKKLAVAYVSSDSISREAAVVRLKTSLADLVQRFNDSMLCGILASLQYCFIENDPALAMQALHKDFISPDFSCRFTAFHLHKYYDGLTNRDDLAFTEQIMQVKEDDRVACFQLIAIYELLLASKNDVNSVEGRLGTVYNLLMNTKRAYKRLMNLSNKRAEVLELYRHFMWDVLNDYSSSQLANFSEVGKIADEDEDPLKKVNFIESSVVLRKNRVESNSIQMTSNNLSPHSSSNSLLLLDRFKKLKKGILHRGRRMRFILAVAFVVVLAIMVGMMMLIGSFIDDLISIDLINEFGAKRMLAARISTESRTLQLIADGYLDVPRNTSGLEAVISRLANAEDLAEGEREKGYDLGKDESVVIWKWEPDMKQSIVNGRECIQQLLSYAKQLTANTTKSAAYYGIRNGVGETQYFLNRTLFKYIDDETTDRHNYIVFVAVLMTCSLVLVMLVYFLILAPHIYFLEGNSRKGFNLIQNLQRENVIEAKNRLFDRLEIVHGEEISFLERDRRRGKPYRRIWPRLALKFGLFVSATVLIVVATYLIYVNKLNDLIQSNPHYSNWAGLRRMTTHSAFFWCRELLLSRRGIGYFDLIASDQLHYTYLERIRNSTQTLDWAHSAIVEGVAKAGIKNIGHSSTRIGMLLDAYPNSTLELDYGIHGGIQEYFNVVEYFVANPNNVTLGAIQNLASKLILAMEDLMIAQQDYIDVEVDATSKILVYLILAYGFLLSGLFIYYSHVIKATNLGIIAVARLHPMIPDTKSSEVSGVSKEGFEVR